MDPSEYLAALRKRWLVVALLAVLGAAAAYGVAATTTPTYRATTKTLVSLQGGTTVSELVQGSTYTQNLVQSYAALASMPVVLDPVIEELGLDVSARKLSRVVTATVPLNTVIIEIAVTSASPQNAADIANSVAKHLAITVSSFYSEASGEQSVTVRTVSPADVPTVPVAPNTKRQTATGLALGLLLGVALALVLHLLDTKVREPRDVARVTDSAVLGSIGIRNRGRALVMAQEPRSVNAEAYRRLRTNLAFLDVSGPLRSFVVTSPMAGDGKSTTSINLALAMAENSEKVVLVDADLRRGSIAEYCGIEGDAGLTTVLIGRATLDDVIQPYGSSGLHILTAGRVPPNPAQLLASQAMQDLLNHLRQTYELVIIDAPPLLPVTDSAVLARLTDGAVVVAAARKTRRAQLSAAIGTLSAVGAPCLGIVLNRVDLRSLGGYYAYPDRAPRGARRRRRRLFGRFRPAARTDARDEVRVHAPEASDSSR